MKLNLDCVRDILMDIESLSDGRHNICISERNYKDIMENCQKYEYGVLFYHIQQCQENGYFTVLKNSLTLDEDFSILDLSPKAHELLAKARNDKFWKKALNAIMKLGEVTLPMLPDLIDRFQIDV